MSTASVSNAQQAQIRTHLPPVLHRQSKQDFTYTFQRVAPVLFVFLLSLSVYTRYKMTHVVITPLTEQIQEYHPAPWETTTPAAHVEADFGEKGWAELRKTLHDSKELSSETIKESWEQLKDLGNKHWEGLKEKSRDRILCDGACATADSVCVNLGSGYQCQPRLCSKLSCGSGDICMNNGGVARCVSVNQPTKDTIIDAAELGKEKLKDFAASGKEKLAETVEAGKEKLAEASEVGKEKLAEASEYGKEKLAEATQFGKEKLAEGKEKLAEASEFGKEKLAEGKEKLVEGKEKLAEGAERLTEFGKEKLAEGKEKLAEASEFGKEKLAEGKEKLVDGAERLTEFGKEKLAEGKEKLAEASEYGKEKLAEASEYGKEKLAEGKEKASGAWEQAKEKTEAVIDSIKEVLPAANLEGKSEQIKEALRDTKVAHTHTTNHHAPYPTKQIFDTLSDKLNQFLEHGAVYQSFAPYNAQCPVLGPNMCPATINTTYSMWW